MNHSFSLGYATLAILIMSVVTYLVRALPFWLFGKEGRTVPKAVVYLGHVLPAAIIAVLVIYCLRNTDIAAGSHGIPEWIAVLAVVLLHIWKRNSIISILGGTVLYMLLLQFVFPM